MGQVNNGIVKWFDERKGFGFITDTETGKEHFVHFSGIISEERFRKLREGDVVTFELQPNEKGDIAVNVKKVVQEA